LKASGLFGQALAITSQSSHLNQALIYFAVLASLQVERKAFRDRNSSEALGNA
jgi:hypothetical protein